MAKGNIKRQGTVLVTGAGKRIGASLARHLAAQGYDLVLHYHRSKGEAEKLAKALRVKGTRVTLVEADLTDTASLPRFWKGLPPVTVFIHNASSFVRDTLATMTPKQLHEHLAIHLEAPLLLAQGFMHQLPKGTSGNIIILGDGELGWCVAPQFFSYGVSKYAWQSVIDLLAVAVAPHARANLLALGPTERNEKESAKSFAAYAKHAPLNRVSHIGDVTAAIDYLLQAEGVTGQAISLANGLGLATFRHRS